jgi:hypothetical protein
MVITLENGQTVTIYEKQNILPQIKEYIDKEIFELLEDSFNNVDGSVIRIEELEAELDDANSYNDELERKIDRLESEIDE